jgi:HAMP domain-containing protein
MKISAKFTLTFISIAILCGGTFYFALNSIQGSLQNQIGIESLHFANDTLLEINKEIYSKIAELHVFSEQLSLVEKISLSNNKFENKPNVDDYISRIDKDWIAGKDTPSIRSILNNKMSEELATHLNFYEKILKNRVFSEIYLTNKYGVIIASTGRTTDYLQADEQWYQKAISNNGEYWGDVKYDESSTTFSIDLVVSLYDKFKNYVGILKGTLALTDIQKVMQVIQSKSQFKSMKLNLVDKEGFLIFSGTGQTLKKHGKDTSLSEFGENISSQEPVALAIRGQEGFILREANGKSLLTSYTPSKGYKDFKGLGWALIVDFETDEVFGSIVQLDSKLRLAFFGTLIIAFCIGIFFIRSFLKPLSILRNGVRKLGEGDFDSKIEIDSKDEVADLADSFNKMAQKIEKDQTNLLGIQGKLETRVIEQTAYLEKAQQIAHLGNWALNIENNNLYWSDEVYRIFGCEPQEFGATYEAFLSFVQLTHHENTLSFPKAFHLPILKRGF